MGVYVWKPKNKMKGMLGNALNLVWGFEFFFSVWLGLRLGFIMKHGGIWEVTSIVVNEELRT